MAKLEHFSVSVFFHSFALEEINVICFQSSDFYIITWRTH